MNPKKKKMLMSKVVAYSFLYLEALDELQATKPETVKFRDDIIGYLESLGNHIKDTDGIKKGMHFQNMANKIDTVVRKNFEE